MYTLATNPNPPDAHSCKVTCCKIKRRGIVFLNVIYFFSLPVRSAASPSSVLDDHCNSRTGWVRIQSTGRARTIPLISIVVCEEKLCLGAVRGVRCVYQ
eukprot:COSAG02_NODE_33551_length_498_cov_0.904762_1_plen_99_part_00